MKSLVIDAYDSFIYIICQYLRSDLIDVTVVRNDQIPQDCVERLKPDFILLGPGPGHPKDAGYVELIRRYGDTIPIFGVCLGHQAIGLAFGGKVERACNLKHGKTSLIEHDQQGCFSKQPSPFTATRYHSLIVAEEGLPESLIVTARSKDDGYVMGLRHKSLPIESVQFHPESIYTEEGASIFRSFIATHVTQRGRS